ncbi:NAD(P)-binding protein [Corynespora cassiicola Philippines]|uniref:NAD(P)-binding protein n=1 Tax=Corynespora cassiicola Philippines TaxID=1448308 RepID=A0A2T2PAW0_CORCC|nr:NAD(P)-binding protein [Corynespora cassiicola Philippines]
MSVFRNGATALITGGASGIGYAVAELCLRHGMRVAIADFNNEILELAKKNLGNVETFHADVSQQEQWKKLKHEVEEKLGAGDQGIDFLMLNAGIGAQGTWGDEDYFQKILQTNLFGVIHGLNAFVPAFQARSKTSPPSAIVVTGSKQGITNPPSSPAYNASKSAVKTLTEHLSYDLRDTTTSVHLLVPGWTFTGLSGNSPTNTTKPKPAGAWTSAQVADYMYSKMQDGKFYIICPDNDVSEETDKKRMQWSVGDIVEGRPPLTRWRPEYKDQVDEFMRK